MGNKIKCRKVFALSDVFLKPFWFKGHSASTSSVYNDIMIVIEFPRWLFEGRPRQVEKVLPFFDVIEATQSSPMGHELEI